LNILCFSIIIPHYFIILQNVEILSKDKHRAEYRYQTQARRILHLSQSTDDADDAPAGTVRLHHAIYTLYTYIHIYIYMYMCIYSFCLRMARASSSPSSIILIELNAFEQRSSPNDVFSLYCLNRVIEISYDRSKKRYRLSRVSSFLSSVRNTIMDWDKFNKPGGRNCIYRQRMHVCVCECFSSFDK